MHLISVCHVYFHYSFLSSILHKGRLDAFHNINTSEINHRHYNKNRTNNAVYLVQSEKYDKLIYIRQTYLGGKVAGSIPDGVI